MRVQLGKVRPIAGAVAALTATLLGSGASAGEFGKLESSLLLYSETDRVQAAEGLVSFNKYLAGGRILGAKLTLDGLTGASPNGATPSRRIQTFTSPSGNGSYSVAPGTTPLDNTFRDNRIALDVSFSQPLDRLTTLVLGGHYSGEQDYTSLAISGGITRDLNKKNTTLGISGSYAHDLSSPMGGAPIPFSTMAASEEDEDNDEHGGDGSSETKNTFDVILGVTQVFDRRTIVRFNYSFSHASGYLNDPYKLISLVQDENSTDPGEPAGYIYEGRPGTRNKQALFGKFRRYLSGNTLDLSYRYFWDDWKIHSHTVEIFYRWQFDDNRALQPHIRWYRQSRADFYRQFLVQGTSLPTYASADYRLGDFDALTLGLQYFLPLGLGSRLSLGAEYYTQIGDRSPPQAFGSLREFDLYPDLKSFIIKLGFERDF